MKRGWHKFTALFLSAMLIVGMIPLSAGATTPNGTGNQTSASQIVENGGTVTAHDGLVSASKTIQGTDTENVFDITLNVTTTEDIKQLDISPDAAVVLVMDVSNSMKEDVNGNSTRWDSERRITKAKAAAQDFLESYVKDAAMPNAWCQWWNLAATSRKSAVGSMQTPGTTGLAQRLLVLWKKPK